MVILSRGSGSKTPASSHLVRNTKNLFVVPKWRRFKEGYSTLNIYNLNQTIRDN